MTARVLLFVRYPHPGEAKTRLIPALGAEGAADLHRALTAHTLRVLDEGAGPAAYDLEVRYTGASPEEMAAWLGDHRVFASQGPGDLGSRLLRAGDDAFSNGVDRLVWVGADCPELTAGDLQRALDLLITTDLVLGPALDGGYYLIGLRRAAWERARWPLFTNMAWGDSSVLTETQRRAHAAGLTLERLAVLGDVDRPEDLVLWEKISGARRGSGPPG